MMPVPSVLLALPHMFLDVCIPVNDSPSTAPLTHPSLFLPQVVLDVRDFQGGDVRVKVVGSSQVQVEGRLEKEEGGRSSTRSFRRRFHLPGVLDVAAVTSALSSDGVLTIRAPKGRPAAGKPSC